VHGKESEWKINKAIDKLLHRHFEKKPWLILVDTLLHIANEVGHGVARGEDPVKVLKRSLMKSLKYVPKEVIDVCMKRRKKFLKK